MKNVRQPICQKEISGGLAHSSGQDSARRSAPPRARVKRTKRRNAPEVKKVKQLALIARLPTHHAKPPPLNPPADGITVRQKSRALFQHHRPLAEVAPGFLIAAVERNAVAAAKVGVAFP
jgi:hypothetical protein